MESTTGYTFTPCVGSFTFHGIESQVVSPSNITAACQADMLTTTLPCLSHSATHDHVDAPQPIRRTRSRRRSVSRTHSAR